MKPQTDLDAALAALAAESRAVQPAPGPDVVGGVLADAAMTTFAAEARRASPEPTAELVARVLSDAAGVSAEQDEAAAQWAAGPAPRLSTTRRGALGDWFFGWAGGAVAAMALGLAVGIGVGLEAAPGALPVLDSPEIDLLSLAAAGPASLLADEL